MGSKKPLPHRPAPVPGKQRALPLLSAGVSRGDPPLGPSPRDRSTGRVQMVDLLVWWGCRVHHSHPPQVRSHAVYRLPQQKRFLLVWGFWLFFFFSTGVTYDFGLLLTNKVPKVYGRAARSPSFEKSSAVSSSRPPFGYLRQQVAAARLQADAELGGVLTVRGPC